MRGYIPTMIGDDGGNLSRLRKQLRPGLRERQIGTGRMHSEPAVRDSGFNRRAIFIVAATGISKFLVDDGYRQATGVIGLYRVRQLKQFLLCGFQRRERAGLLELHFPRFRLYLASASELASGCRNCFGLSLSESESRFSKSSG